MEVIEFLKRSSFFQGISNTSLISLSEIAIQKSAKRRELLFLEDQEGVSMYLLQEGSVQLYKTSAEGKEVVIKTIKPGEIFGEVILFEKKTYPVSAITLAESRLLLFPKVQIDCLLMDEGFRRDFIAMLMQKQRYLAERILFLTAHEVEDRFFYFLKEQFGERETYRILMSKKDLASSIGTVPETFSRMILRLKKESTLQWSGQILRLRSGFWEAYREGELNRDI